MRLGSFILGFFLLVVSITPASAEPISGNRVVGDIPVSWTTENRGAARYFASDIYVEDLEALDSWLRPFIGVPLRFYISSIGYTDKSRANGSANLRTHAIEVEGVAKEASYGPDRLRGTLLHEMGHLLFNRYLERNSAVYRALLQKQAANRAASTQLLQYQVAARPALVAYHELVADLLAVIILGDPQRSSRNFAQYAAMWRNGEGFPSEVDVHHQCDVVRGFLWANYLERGFSMPRAAVQFVDIVMRDSMQLWEKTTRKFWQDLAHGQPAWTGVENDLLMQRIAKTYPIGR